MTTTEAILGGVSYPANKLDIWRESQSGIGRFEVLLDEAVLTVDMLRPFSPEITALLKINGSTMMQGYVDDVLPNVDDPSAVYHGLVKITGRDYGQDLANLFLNKEYVASSGAGLHWDDILYDTLVSAGSEIYYTLTSVGAPLAYSFKNQYLLDGFKEMAKLVGFDFYVSDQKRLMAFLLGDAASSGITLNSTYAGPNNILALSEIGYRVGFDIRNYVQVEAGDLDDHWTEGNATDYSVSEVDVISDATDHVVKNGSSIKAEYDDGSGTYFMMFWLQFPKYNYTTIDLSEVAKASCSAWFRHDDTINPSPQLGIYVMDDSGNELYNKTPYPLPNKWYEKTFDMGYDATGWTRLSGTGFTWDLTRIGAVWVPPRAHRDYYTVWFDGLKIPGVTAKGIAEDLDSQGSYRKRMIPITRTDLKSQIQLDSTAATELAHRKDPTQRIKVTAPFQSSADYAGKTIVVNEPLHDIINASYRILSLHHTAEPDNTLLRGYDAITEFDLVKADQPVDPFRLRLSQNPSWIYSQSLESRVRSLERGTIR